MDAAESARTIDAILRDGAEADVLRFVTCGSVDHGKSTLIGRLLADSQLLYEDQLRALESDSRAHGTVGDGIDYALLLDGLEDEIEQGITIDVAYRYFTAKGRRFIVADSPGHEQYTRNMATAASTADLALIVVDAREGLLTQTRRHSYIFALFGISAVVLAVNKMDLVGYDEGRFNEIAAAYQEIATKLGLSQVQCIPVSALQGDNVTARSPHMPWYQGSSLLDHLATVRLASDPDAAPFRFPVQRANRPDSSFRGYSGSIASGSVKVGDEVTVQPAGRKTRIAQIVTADGTFQSAACGEAVTLTLADELDVGRGDMICAGAEPLIADQYGAHLLWMDEAELLPGRQYLIKCGTRTARAAVSTLKHRININTLDQQAATTLHLNEIGYVNLTIDQALVGDPYKAIRATGAFILIDPFTNHTVGAGVIDFALRRATNVAWQHLEIDKKLRAEINQQRPCVLWFTGLSGAGKSTIADLVERKLTALGRRTYLLDGDNVRHGLNRDLGFTPEARVENVRRVGEVAKLFVDAGLIVLVSLISPYRAERDMARHLLEDGEFVEIYVATPLEECERRDPKGLYRRARSGQIPNFTGIDSPYEAPDAPELILDTTGKAADAMADQIVAYLQARSYI